MAIEQLQQISFVSPTGSVGGGISGAALDEAMSHSPHFIACDAGTTDAGPFSLGMGMPAFPREAVKRDLALMLLAGRKAKIPVIVGSAGTAGATRIVSVTTSTTVLKSLKPFLVFPTIASFTPTSGKVGSQVVIHGTGLTGTTLVSIGNVKATVFAVNSPTQVTATVPTGAKTGKVALTTAGGSTTSSGTFTILP